MADWKDLLASFNTVIPTSKADNKKGEPSMEDRIPGFHSGCGIIYTDTFALSQKFQIPREDVTSVINQFINDSCRIGRDWILLDFCNCPRYQERDKSWETYLRFLYDTCKEYNWHTDIATNLFIIGGDDVIAVPQRVFEIDLLDLRAEIDMLYCFPYGFDLTGEISHWINIRKVYDPEELYGILSDCAKFNVSRLPLPNGIMGGKYAFMDTLEYYFKKAVASASDYNLSSVCFATAKSFETASENMAKGLPLITRKSPSAYSPNGVYRSPLVDIGKGRPVEQPFLVYVQDLKNADLLLFNCHGSDVPSASSYGDSLPSTNTWYTAYDTHIPDDLSRNSLTLSCACWGARYMHYSEETSILLKSMFKSSVLNFAGSSTIAWGSKNGAYSEVFLRLFIDYLVKGYNSGEAFMRAKLEYFVRFCEYKEGVDIETMYLTISEFNLFGDPKVAYHASGEWDEMTHEWIQDGIGKTAVDKSRYSGVAAILESVYEATRYSVDSALMQIDKMLRVRIEQLYSLKELNLLGVKTKKSHGEELGYKFCYSYDYGRMGGYVMAVTDKNGVCKDISLSK